MLVIAHRGASAVAPENTVAAIKMAAASGAHMVEVDVQMTRDRRLVVFHDDTLERTTNGVGRLSRQTYTALSQLDAGSWFNAQFSGEHIPLVTQILRLVPRHMGINLELKHSANRSDFLQRLLRLLRREQALSRVLVSSFDPSLLHLLREVPVARALICRHQPDQALQSAITLGCLAWHPSSRLINKVRVERAHAAGLRVHTWTVDDPAQARVLERMGVDGIFTNHPSRLLR